MFSMVFKRDFSSAQRKAMAKSGEAMSDGSFPIANAEDLRNAIILVSKASDPSAAKAHIIKRAKALNLSSKIPESWVGAEKDDGSDGEVETDVETDDQFMEAFTADQDGELVLKDSAASFKAWVTRKRVHGDTGLKTTRGVLGMSGARHDRAHSITAHTSRVASLAKTLTTLGFNTQVTHGDSMGNVTGLQAHNPATGEKVSIIRTSARHPLHRPGTKHTYEVKFAKGNKADSGALAGGIQADSIKSSKVAPKHFWMDAKVAAHTRKADEPEALARVEVDEFTRALGVRKTAPVHATTAGLVIAQKSTMRIAGTGALPQEGWPAIFGVRS